MKRSRPSATHRRGMVLIAVLWIVAALSVIVTGTIHSVRGEVRQVSVGVQLAQGDSWGGGAIAITLQNLIATSNGPPAYLRMNVGYQGRDIDVQARSLSGFIDINMASVMMLEKLFSIAAGLAPASASTLAQAVVEQRNRKDPQGRPMRFEAVEDLLQVPGMEYDVYFKVAELVTTDARGSGRVNVAAAPMAVLMVLADGNQPVAQRIAQQRDAGVVGFDTTALNPQLVDNATSRRYVVQARVPLSDGTWLLTSRWVDLSGGRREGLPWRVFHTDNRLQPAVP
jgi:general secretion pathway protein K